MMLRKTRTTLAILLGAAFAVAAAGLVTRDPPQDAASATAGSMRPSGSSLEKAVASPALTVPQGDRMSKSPIVRDLFGASGQKARERLRVRKTAPAPAAQASVPLPVVPVVEAPSAPPSPPPMPFQYVGSMQEDGRSAIVYLSKGDKAYTAEVGEVLDGTYQVERIEEGVITLIYLPLNVAQTLRAPGYP